MDKLSVVGLGKLGACTAVCFAQSGYEVIGVDINKNFVDAINSGKAPVCEPHLQELITSSKDRLSATQDYRIAIEETDITFLIVPTPSKEDGSFSDEYLKEALESLATVLKNSNKSYHLFVITSTVSPGTIDNNLIPLIEKVSTRKLNKGFGVCYNPEFIALGSVIDNFLNPDLVLIGESDKFAGDKLEKIYKSVCKNKPYIARMSIISAEITKLSLNVYVTMKISFANTLSNICEKVNGADIDAITRALGQDKRISPYYLKGGLSFGGPCFPRDNRAFISFAKKYGCEAKLAKVVDEINETQTEHLTEIVLKYLSEVSPKAVSVLGLAYKPNTPVIEESPAIKLIQNLLDNNVKVTVYDPLAMDNTKLIFNNSIHYASSKEECIAQSPLCVITLPLDEFKTINDNFIAYNHTIVIDCWRVLDLTKLSNKLRYIALGKADISSEG